MRDFEVDPLRESALFARAMELEPRGRDAFLARECEGNAGLLLAVQQLLHAAEQAQSKPSWELSALTIEAAAIASQWNPGGVERYQILDCIGAGGMGVVYRARRDDRHFDKTVAVKVVQSREPAIVERFRQERQIMADLDHPNIAHVLDGGLTREGMPFLVMEFVDGVPIDRYVSDHGLAQRARLVLFRKVCSAVSHAHSKLIVHRDLKPANILVTPAGEPKLLDFGIAKLLDESAPRTITSATALTPEYASPEQITGGAITTASDVYSLGVLLYQMLRGRRPHRDTGSAVELAALIVKGEFDPLRGVDGDLANIVHMALRREPERRYQSVEQLSEDLRRYMEGYPVLACPDTRAYRFAKFAVRNRLPLIAGSLTFLALLAGTSVALWQARLAQRRFDDVRKIANTYLFEIHDAIRDLPGSTPARKLVAKGALEYLDRLSSESGGDPGLLREVAGAYMRLGAVQGSPRFASLGDREGAIASYGKAKAILQRLSTRSPRDAGTAVELARARIALSELLQAMGDLSNAEREDAGATTLLESQAAVNPGDANIQEMLSAAYRLAADIQANPDLPNLGKPQEALRYLEKALRIWRERARLKPEDRETRFRLSLVLGRIAAIRISLADRSGGEAALEEALQVNQQLVREEPLNAVYRREVAIYSNNIARNLVRMDSVAAALEYGDRSGAIFENSRRPIRTMRKRKKPLRTASPHRLS